MRYDCIIIGAGLSGLAAAIRLAHFGKKVCICEQHSKTGGLNSWYKKAGFEIDSGLHAMTNFTKAEGHKSLPLKKLLRQLRIPYEKLQLREQNGSEIVFPEKRLRFSNDFELLRSEVAENFKAEIDRFNILDDYILDYDGLNVTSPFISARKVLQEKINDKKLIEMLFCPLMYYGSAVENDMDFSQFSIMYKSIFHEGFCRPSGGVKALLDILKARFIECGGEIINARQTESFPEVVMALNCSVDKLNVKRNKVVSVVISGGRIIEADKILSSAGFAETIQLADNNAAEKISKGNLSFVETVILTEKSIAETGHDKTIIFFNEDDDFAYKKPQELFDIRSGVVCCPENFKNLEGDSCICPQVRVTMLADYQKWFAMKNDFYLQAKDKVAEAALKTAAKYTDFSDLRENIIMTDVFSPKTILRFTRHLNGAIYGSPDKQKTGSTEFENLFLCGTDQGFLGITGAMLSGISMANMHILQG